MSAVTFTRAGFAAGMRGTAPLAVSVFAYGAIFGVLARQAGLSPVESLLMSGLVYAGSAQFVALELWTAPPSVPALALTTLVVNLRLLLMGAALRPWLAQLPAAKAYGPLFFLSDESWALAMGEYERGYRDAAFLLGSGLTLYGAWLAATGAGYLAGATLGEPTRWGLDFAFTAVFAALLVGMYRGRRDLAPWAVAAIVAIVAERLLPGQWYILLGGIAACVAGLVSHGR